MITIGIPFYNDERFLDLAIKSVFKQTYTDWKLILISDGGTDNSLNIAQKYESDPRITIIYDGENRKLPYRLNQLSDMVETKYYARMDADDIMHPRRLETQLKILDDNPEIDILGTNAYSIDENNNIQGVKQDTNNDKYLLLDCTGFIHPSIMGRTKWFKENPYDEKAIRAEDFELWQRTGKKSVFRVWTEPLLFYREFGANYYKKYFNGIKTMFYISIKLNSMRIFLYSFVHIIKSIVFYILWLFRIENLLINRRSNKISGNNLSEAQEQINKISVEIKNNII